MYKNHPTYQLNLTIVVNSASYKMKDNLKQLHKLSFISKHLSDEMLLLIKPIT